MSPSQGPQKKIETENRNARWGKGKDIFVCDEKSEDCSGKTKREKILDILGLSSSSSSTVPKQLLSAILKTAHVYDRHRDIVVFNIGAGIGEESSFLCSIGPTARIHSFYFEADEDKQSLLSKNVEASECGQLALIMPLAVGDVDGKQVAFLKKKRGDGNGSCSSNSSSSLEKEQDQQQQQCSNKSPSEFYPVRSDRVEWIKTACEKQRKGVQSCSIFEQPTITLDSLLQMTSLSIDLQKMIHLSQVMGSESDEINGLSSFVHFARSARSALHESDGRIDVLLIDTEGFDGHVIRGAKSLLPKTFAVLFECSELMIQNSNVSLRATTEELEESGFDVLMLGTGKNVRIGGLCWSEDAFSRMASPRSCLALNRRDILYPTTLEIFGMKRRELGCM